jgi:hypothetical protein
VKLDVSSISLGLSESINYIEFNYNKVLENTRIFSNENFEIEHSLNYFKKIFSEDKI